MTHASVNPLHLGGGLLLASILLSGCASVPERPAPELTPELEQKTPSAQPLAPDPAPNPTDLMTLPSAPDAAEAQFPDERIAPGLTRAPRAVTLALDTQRFAYSEHGEIRRAGPISSGRPGYPTPRGRFRVLSKDIDKTSSRYTNQLGWPAWMPYSIQFHGHYFLHEGWLPGYPDSHGCVRLDQEDARYLFERLQLGDAVVVIN